MLSRGYRFDEVLSQCHAWNANNNPPLDDDKIDSTCESIASSDQRNHPERYSALQTATPLFDLAEGRIDAYLSTPPAPRRWLINGLVVLGKVGAVVAPGGSSKSQWMLQLGVSVATGIPLAGYWSVGERGGVLALFAEDDKEEIGRRLHRINGQLTLEGYANDLSKLKESLYVFSTIGTDTLLTQKRPAGEAARTTVVDRIVELANQVPDLRLILIDPISRFRGGEENSNEDATRFVEALEVLAQKTGATVIVAHHANKSSTFNGDVSQGASRGASALTDGLRLQINLNRPSDSQLSKYGLPKDEGSRYVVTTVTKSNYSAIPAPALLERCEGGYLSAVNAAAAQQKAQNDAISAVLVVLAGQIKPISARILEERFGGVHGKLQMSKQQIRAAVARATDVGLIEGGQRKPLKLTAKGAVLAQSSLPTPAVAPTLNDTIAPKKT